MKVIIASKLVDAKQIIENPVVIVEENKIVKVGKKSDFKIPNNAEVFEEPNLVIIPGC